MHVQQADLDHGLEGCLDHVRQRLGGGTGTIERHQQAADVAGVGGSRRGQHHRLVEFGDQPQRHVTREVRPIRFSVPTHHQRHGVGVLCPEFDRRGDRMAVHGGEPDVRAGSVRARTLATVLEDVHGLHFRPQQ